MARFTSFLSAVCAVALSGCSVLLDPETCASDSECAPGVCSSSGVCIGERATGQDQDVAEAGGDDDGGVDADVLVPDVSVDATPDTAVDAEPDVTVDAAPAEAPTCELLTPAEGHRLTADDSIPISFLITDTDTALDALTVTLNGDEIVLDEDGQYEGAISLIEGANPVVITATDPEALSCELQIEVVADHTAPVCEFDNVPPDADRLLTNQAVFTLEGHVDRAEAHFVEILNIDFDGDAAETTWENRAFSVALTLDEGDNAISVTVEDEVGHTSEPCTVLLELDTTGPDVEISAPLPDAEVMDARIEVCGQTEADALVDIEVTGAGDDEVSPRLSNDGTFCALVALGVGENHITICAEDVAANRTCETLDIMRADDQPCVTIEAPAADLFLPSGPIEITGTICPSITSVTLHIDGAGAGADAAIDAETFQVSVNLDAAGAHCVVARAENAAGQSAEDEVCFNYDPTPPALSVSRPLEGSCTNVDAVSVCGSVQDPESGISALQINEIEDENNAGLFCVDVPVEEGADVRLRAIATNGAGMSNEVELTINVDRVAPAIVLDQPSLSCYRRFASGQVTLRGHLDAGVCGALSLLVEGTPAGISPDGTFTARRTFEDGLQSAQFLVTDIAENEGESNFAFRADGTAPLLSNITPGLTATITEDTLEVTATVADNVGGCGLGSATIGDVETAIINGRITRIVADIPEGESEIVITLLDAVGNTAQETIRVNRDVQPPSLTITVPLPGETVASPAMVQGTVDDGELGAGVATVTVNGLEANVSPDGTWRAMGVPLAAGDATVNVVAVDSVGNTTEPGLSQAVHVIDFAAAPAARDGLDGVTHTRWIGLADLNNDGLTDVVALSGQADGSSGVFLQAATEPAPIAPFVLRPAALAGLPEGAVITDAAFGDFNADGHMDLLIVGDGTNGLWLGQGNGSFELHNSGIANGLSATGCTVGDLDGDGDLDAIIFAGVATRLLTANGDGSFEAEPLGVLSDLTSAIRGTLVDLNLDGRLNLVAVGPTGTFIYTNGSGGLSPLAESGFNLTPAVGLALIDAESDGTLDVFTASTDDARLNLNRGANTFEPEARGLSWPVGAIGARAADLTADGRDDLLVYGEHGLIVFEQAADAFARLDEASAGLVTGAVTALTIGDIDGDGDIDVITGDAEGLTLLRSSLSVTRAPYRFVRVAIQRGVEGSAGPTDAAGVGLFTINPLSLVSERALVTQAAIPTIVTLGASETVALKAVFVDLGEAGNNTKQRPDIESGTLLLMTGRE